MHNYSARAELQKTYQRTTTDTAAGVCVRHPLNRMRNVRTVHNNGDAVRSDTITSIIACWYHIGIRVARGRNLIGGLALVKQDTPVYTKEVQPARMPRTSTARGPCTRVTRAAHGCGLAHRFSALRAQNDM